MTRRQLWAYAASAIQITGYILLAMADLKIAVGVFLCTWGYGMQRAWP